ncbi:MAG: hypothetical protein ACRELB_20740, partial [Polyangiaceae bacterium]
MLHRFLKLLVRGGGGPGNDELNVKVEGLSRFVKLYSEGGEGSLVVDPQVNDGPSGALARHEELGRPFTHPRGSRPQRLPPQH